MTSTPPTGPGPTRVLEVELAGPIPRVEGGMSSEGLLYEGALVLVRLHSTPLGILHLPLAESGMEPEQLAEAIWRELREPIRAHLAGDGHEEPDGLPWESLSAETGTPACRAEQQRILENAPPVSVILATHERGDLLRNALDALGRLSYPNVEILVIDNAPRTDVTAEVVRQYPNVRYIREGRPGLSWARNRGIVEARGEILAFTDDDIVVDQHWVTELVRGFDLAENVACVTGLILPYELETPAQAWFEGYGGFGRGTQTRIYDLDEHRPGGPTFPYSLGVMGPIMAFRADVLRGLGGFDPALGAGTPSLGGEDLLVLFDLLAGGYRIVYNAGAIEYHRHRREYEVLHRQMYAYGAGFTAYVTSLLIRHPHVILDFLGRIPAGLRQLLRTKGLGPGSEPAAYPRPLRNEELRGMVAGPLYYARSRRVARHIAATLGPLDVTPQPGPSPVASGGGATLDGN